MVLRCGPVGDVEGFDRFRVFLTSTLGVSSVIGLGLFAVPCGCASVARYGSIPGILNYATMADALSVMDNRDQIVDCRRSGPIAYFHLL